MSNSLLLLDHIETLKDLETNGLLTRQIIARNPNAGIVFLAQEHKRAIECIHDANDARLLANFSGIWAKMTKEHNKSKKELERQANNKEKKALRVSKEANYLTSLANSDLQQAQKAIHDADVLLKNIFKKLI